MNDEQKSLGDRQGMNATKTALTQATYRALRMSYSDADDTTLSAHAAALVAADSVAFDGGGSLRVAREEFVTANAPRLVGALNGPIFGSDDRSKTARALRRERELAPLRPAAVVRTADKTLTEALNEVAKMPARTELEKCARARAREQVLEAYSSGTDGAA